MLFSLGLRNNKRSLLFLQSRCKSTPNPADKLIFPSPRAEFACRCGEYHEPYCDGFPAEPDQTLVELLDDIRAHFGRPAIRSSGLRCPQHNRDSNGVANSKHLSGKAMDFYVQDTSGEAVRTYAAADPRCNYTYVIEGNYVHVDVA